MCGELHGLTVWETHWLGPPPAARWTPGGCCHTHEPPLTHPNLSCLCFWPEAEDCSTVTAHSRKQVVPSSPMLASFQGC